jgi:thiamine-phosphate pyrophosphorylase
VSTFPSLSPAGERRHARLTDSRIVAVVDARRPRSALEDHLRELCGASADVCRLRDDAATEDELRAAADVFRRVCDDAGTLFVVDRFPGLAVQVGADGVHLGRLDTDPDRARQIVGPDLLIGRAARTPGEVDASADQDVDLLVVGEGLPPEEHRLAVAHAADHASHPWFAAGGEPSTVRTLIELGARRVVADPEAVDAGPARTCWALRRALASRPSA